MRSVRILALVAAAAVVTVFALPAQAAPVQMTANMTGDEEVPQKGPAGATGGATLEIKSDTNEICYTFVTQNLNEAVTQGHIHKGAKGAAGDVFINLNVAGGNLKGCVPSEAAKIEALLANPQGYYVNLHSEAHPMGVLRGQLEAAITNPQAAVPEGSTTTSSGSSPAIARTGAGSAGLLTAIALGLLSLGTAARFGSRRH